MPPTPPPSPRSFDRLDSLSSEMWTKCFYPDLGCCLYPCREEKGLDKNPRNSLHDYNFRSGESVFLSHPLSRAKFTVRGTYPWVDGPNQENSKRRASHNLVLVNEDEF